MPRGIKRFNTNTTDGIDERLAAIDLLESDLSRQLAELGAEKETLLKKKDDIIFGELLSLFKASGKTVSEVRIALGM